MALGIGKRGTLNAEINVTPLVDVMLVLLVIFMVTAPMLSTGVGVDLPKAAAPVLSSKNDKLILTINRKSVLFLAGKKLRFADLTPKLREYQRSQKTDELYIEADTQTPYGTVLQAMAAATQAGISKLRMLTDPLETP